MSKLERLSGDRAADPELARLFGAGRAPEPLSPAAYRRSRKRVLALAAAPAALGVLGWVQHAALGAALGTTVAVVAALPRLLAPAPSSPPAPSASARILSSAAPQRAPASLARAPVASAAPAPAPAPEATTASPLRAPPLTSTPEPALSAEHALVRETRLLENARGELEQRPAASLRWLAEHEREFPNGALALEREFLTVAALVRLGERARAEARAATLRNRAPGLLYERRLERILGGGGAAP